VPEVTSGVKKNHHAAHALRVIEDPALPLPPAPALGGLPLDLTQLAPRTDRLPADDVHVLPNAHFRVAITTPAPLRASRVVTTPFSAEGAYPLRGGLLHQRVFAPPALPAALFEWNLDGAAGHPVSLVLSWEVVPSRAGAGPRVPGPDPLPPASELDAASPGDHRLRWRAEGTRLVLRGGGPPCVTCVALSVEPLAWDVRDLGGNGTRVGGSLPLPLAPGEPLRLLVAVAADDDELRSTLFRVDDPMRLVRALAATARRTARERLAISTPDPDLDRAFEWAKARLTSGACVRESGGGHTLAARASHAIGDFTGAAEAIRLVPPDEPELATSLREYLAWTGDFASVGGTARRTGLSADVAHAPAQFPFEWDERVRDWLPRVAADPAAAAALLLGFVHGILGAVPDAPRHRLVLRPRFPGAWDHARVTNLRMADASLSFVYRRIGNIHELDIDQLEGAAPVRLVLEPMLPGTRLAAAAVDGVTADLDWSPAAEGRVTPAVQVVLDAPRSLRLVTD
jgi:hypothetical protein